MLFSSLAADSQLTLTTMLAELMSILEVVEEEALLKFRVFASSLPSSEDDGSASCGSGEGEGEGEGAAGDSSIGDLLVSLMISSEQKPMVVMVTMTVVRFRR